MNGNQIEEEEESLVPKKGLIYSILVFTSFFSSLILDEYSRGRMNNYK